MHIFADGFTRVSLSGGVVRFTLVQSSGDQKTTEVGDLLIPAGRVEVFVQGLNSALKRLAEQIKEEQGNAKQVPEN